MPSSHHQPSQDPPWYKTPIGIVCIGFMGVAAFFLIMEHRAHVYGVLPILLLLICPLMHFFMHGHHGSHDQSSNKEEK